MNSHPSYDVIIIGGFGHVGLPLGIVLADCGLRVGLLDIDTSKRSMIEAGTMPFIEYDAEPILKRVIGKSLTVCNDLKEVASAKAIIITIGTPVDEYLSPKTRPFFELADKMTPYLSKEHCVILRSTVYPGTSQSLSDHWKKQGKDVQIAFCPERIVQGYAIRELKTLPQVVSGTSPQAVAIASILFRKLGVEIVKIGVEEAELTKLFLNAWRYIQFAVGNQFYMMAKDRGLEYEKIYHAMTHHYDRGDIPGPGFAAGPCLLKDTMQLSAAYRNQFFIGHAAMMVNEGLPSFVIDQLLAEHGSISGKTIGILGMAFKKDIDDVRDSLSFKLLKILRFHGARVLTSDEFASDASFVPKQKLLDEADIIIVGVPHTAYRSMKIPKGKKIIDLWGVFGHDTSST